MKIKSILILACFTLLCISRSNAQIETKIIGEEPPKEVYTMVEEMPEFPGGPVQMMKFIQKNIVYPKSAIEKKITGKCFLKFIINADGSISDVVVLKGVPECKDCDDESIRVVKSMPKWKPAKQSGKAVPVYFNLPINFSR